MAKLTYPIVFIFNPETKLFNGFVPDLAIYAEGVTRKDVTEEAEHILVKYMELAQKYKTDIPKPTSMEKTKEKWKAYEIGLVSVKV